MVCLLLLVVLVSDFTALFMTASLITAGMRRLQNVFSSNEELRCWIELWIEENASFTCTAVAAQICNAAPLQSSCELHHLFFFS